MVTGNDDDRRLQGRKHGGSLFEFDNAGPLCQIPAYGDEVNVQLVDFIDKRPNDPGMRNLAEMQIRYVCDPESAHYSNMESGSSIWLRTVPIKAAATAPSTTR